MTDPNYMHLGDFAETFDPLAAVEDLGIPVPREIGVADSNPGAEHLDLLEGATFERTPTEAAVKVGINPKDLIGATKIDLSVVPPSAELHLATAMMDGAKKYGPFNWRENAVLARVYISAARRHLLQFLDGEDYDPISNVHHLGHAMACCAIILDAMETGNLDDDRPVPGAAGEMIRRFQPDSKLT